MSKVIIKDDDGTEYEYEVIDGCGAFVTKNGNTILLPSNNNDINMHVLKMILK